MNSYPVVCSTRDQALRLLLDRAGTSPLEELAEGLLERATCAAPIRMVVDLTTLEVALAAEEGGFLLTLLNQIVVPADIPVHLPQLLLVPRALTRGMVEATYNPVTGERDAAADLVAALAEAIARAGCFIAGERSVFQPEIQPIC